MRICSPLRGYPASSVNLGLAKPSDSSGVAYLALGALIHAGLDGIRSKIDPGEAVNTDPAVLSDAERARLGAHRLPCRAERRAGRAGHRRAADGRARAAALDRVPGGQVLGRRRTSRSPLTRTTSASTTSPSSDRWAALTCAATRCAPADLRGSRWPALAVIGRIRLCDCPRIARSQTAALRRAACAVPSGCPH